MKISENEFWNMAPEEWSKPMATVQDTAEAIFIHDGQPSLILFSRVWDNKVMCETFPMAATKTGKIFVITGVGQSGIFVKSLSLALEDDKGRVIEIKIPFSQIAKGYEETTAKFCAWAMLVCRTNKIAGVRPTYFMFQPVTDMANLPSRTRLGKLSFEELQKVQRNIEVVKINQVFSDSVDQLRGDYLWLEQLEKALNEVTVDFPSMGEQRLTLLKSMQAEVPQLKQDIWAKYEKVRLGSKG